MRHLPFFVVASAVGLMTIACGSGRDRSGFENDRAGNASSSGQPSEAPGGNLGSSGSEPSSSGQPATCAATVNQATRAEVDIIVVIDYNVIMIAEKPQKLPFTPPGFTPPGICVQPPLAGADCADGPKFHHLNTGVGSTDSLQIILDKYSQYSAWLRQTAYKVFIEVTDDNSSLAYATFDQQLLAKSPQHFGDANARRYIFNSICGYKRNTPVLSSEKCSSAENTGDQYQHLSQLTGGTVDAVCETSYASVFDNIAKGLITKLGCEFAFPKTDNGQPTDPTTVVVTYSPGAGSPGKALTQVTDASKCGANPDGWFYDNAASPTKILFCPSTCDGPGADTAGKLEVAVGCAAPPPK